MDAVGVGEQQQPLIAPQAFEQALRNQRLGKEDAGPDVPELLIGDLHVEQPAGFCDKILRADLPLLETLRQPGPANEFGDALRGVRAHPRQCLVAAAEVHRDDHIAEIKQNRLDHLLTLRTHDQICQISTRLSTVPR